MISRDEHEAMQLGRSLADVLLRALVATAIAPQDQRLLWVGLISELETYCDGMIHNGDAHEVLRDAHETAKLAHYSIRAMTDVDALDSIAYGLRGFLTPQRTKLVAACILERLAAETTRNRHPLLFSGMRRYADSILKHREWLRNRRFAP